MARRPKDNPTADLPDGWPAMPSDDKVVVLHTRVVTDTGGGPDKTILYSAPFLADTEYWLAAAYMHPPDDKGFDAVRKRAATAQCPLFGIPDAGPLDRSVIRTMLDICKRYNVRVWHGHDYKSNAIGLMLRPFWNMKLVSTVHGWVKHTSRTPLYYAVDRWCLPYYHHVICVSDDLVEAMQKNGVPAERLSLILNGIDEKTFIRKFPAAQSPLREKYNTPPNRLVIGAVGRLSAEKAFNNLIRAVHPLIQSGLDIELWIAGDGDAKPELEKLIAHLQLADRVKLLGFTSDTLGLYHAMDIFALSSLREGLPNVVLEAMSMSVPVVSTAVAGVPRLITDGTSGLLVPIADVESLSTALRRVVESPDLRRSLATQGRAVIERDFSFCHRMMLEKAVYDRVLNVAGAPTGRIGQEPMPVTQA